MRHNATASGPVKVTRGISFSLVPLPSDKAGYVVYPKHPGFPEKKNFFFLQSSSTDDAHDHSDGLAGPLSMLSHLHKDGNASLPALNNALCLGSLTLYRFDSTLTSPLERTSLGVAIRSYRTTSWRWWATFATHATAPSRALCRALFVRTCALVFHLQPARCNRAERRHRNSERALSGSRKTSGLRRPHNGRRLNDFIRRRMSHMPRQ